jgi:carbamoyl-phosphate synthase large subunit
VVIICSIENFDPMGVHTGDSVTVAPTQTLTDKQYQLLRDAAIRMMRSIGTFAGGCNVQFAMEPGTDRLVAIEINPRVSRSSALASKATGYPIAKIASKLAVGYNLDELENQITKTTSACFEPSLDYVVVKVPRFNFEKFPGVDEELTTQMKAVGEVMSIGRTFPEALNKAWQSLEIGRGGLGADGYEEIDREEVRKRLLKPYWDRSLQIRNAFKLGTSIEEIHDITQIDPWFLSRSLPGKPGKPHRGPDPALHQRRGHARAQAGRFLRPADRLAAEPERRRPHHREAGARKTRKMGIRAVFKMVDTCAGEFPASTPYYYSCYDDENESVVTDRKKVMILGSGPNRIGQGIEFDYSCVHAVLAARDMGYETIMVNCNPETVSTDFDIADKLYFEPVYWEHVYNIIQHEKPEGIILQVGGQTALKLAKHLTEHNVRIFGTPFEMMDLAEDRGKFSETLLRLNIPFPAYGTAFMCQRGPRDRQPDQIPRAAAPQLCAWRPGHVHRGQGQRA